MSLPTNASHATPTPDPAVEALLAAGRDRSFPDVHATWGRLQEELSRETGPLSWLRSRSTPIRTFIVIAVSVLVVLGVVVATPRVDLEVLPLGRMIADLALLGGPLGLVLAVAAYPVHRAPLHAGLKVAAVALAVVAVLGVCSLPPAHLAHPASLEGTGPDLAARAFGCFMFGAIVAVPTMLIARATARTGQGPGRWVPTLAVAAVGVLVGSIGLYLHCPITAAAHLLAGHATVWIPFGIVALTLGRHSSDG